VRVSDIDEDDNDEDDYADFSREAFGYPEEDDGSIDREIEKESGEFTSSPRPREPIFRRLSSQ
jgi:hypothetical protein